MFKKWNRQNVTFISVIAAVHILFFLMACSYTRIYMGDSFEYIYEALNIKSLFFFYSGNPAMPITPEYMTQRQPGYPLFLLLVYLFTINNWIVLVLQNALSVFNIWYVRKTLLAIGFQKKYDWLLLLLIAAYPAQFINANTIAPDILLQTCTVLYFGGFIATWRTGKLRDAITMSMALVGGLLVKPVLYPFVAVHLFIVVILFAVRGRKLQRPMAVAIMPLCAVLLYNAWNYARTEKFHFTSNQAFNAIYYFYPYIAQKEGADSARYFLIKERREIAMLPEYKDRYDYANELGWRLLEKNFWPYLFFHLKNSARIFVEPGKAEMDLFTGRLTYGRLYSREQIGFYATLRNNGWAGIREYIKRNPALPLVLLVFLFNCARLVGFILFVASGSTSRSVRIFTTMLIVYFAIAAGPIANTRYFLPVSLIMAGCAAMGYSQRRNRRKPGQILINASGFTGNGLKHG